MFRNLSWFEFLLGALATYRLSLLVSKEDGPYFLMAKLRKLPPPKSSTKAGLQCQWCTAIWASAVVCGLFAWAGIELHPARWLISWLAMSAGAIGFNQVFTKGK